jgi:hypothetical protein
LLIDFIDDKKLRVTPATVEFVNGESRLIVYRKSGLDVGSIKLKHGDAIAEANITQLSETTAMIVVVDSKLQDSVALTLVSGDDCSELVSIPITRK